MKKIFWKPTLMTALLIANLSTAFADDHNAKQVRDSISQPVDSLKNITKESLEAYWDSIYRIEHPQVVPVVYTDSGKTVPQPRSQRSVYTETNSYVPNSVPVNTSYAVGQIDVQSGISPTGAKTYSVPIKSYSSEEVFGPEITLNYNSQGSGSSYGKGWSIGGLQSIRRTNKSIYFDDKTDGIKMNANDAFYLNGVRLLRTSTNAYEYETEQGNIKAIATVSGNVVKYFTVYFPNGCTGVFGQTSNTENKLEYPITTLTDERERSITYYYNTYGNANLISTIYYANSAASIVFSYESTRADKEYKYCAGQLLENQYLLKSIECKRQSNQICKYTMTYTTDHNTSLLTQLDCSANGSSLNPLRFYYGTDSAADTYSTTHLTLNQGYSFNYRYLVNVARGRYNYSNGDDGIVYYPNEEPYFHLSGSNYNYLQNKNNAQNHAYIYNNLNDSIYNRFSTALTLDNGFIDILTADLDGTRQECIVKVNNYDYGNYDRVIFSVYQDIGLGSITQKYAPRIFDFSTLYTDLSGHKSVRPKYYYTGDFNGDGKMEILMVTAANPFGGTTGSSMFRIIDLNNNSFLYSGSPFNYVKVLSGDLHDAMEAENMSDKIIPIDYDGDGKTDLCHIHSSGMSVYTFTQNGTTLTTQLIYTNTGINKSALANRFYSIGDFNGDGLTDFILSGSSNSQYWSFYFSKGNGAFYQEQGVSGPTFDNGNKSFLLQDIDGDGVTDLVELNDNNFTGYLVKNKQFIQSATQSLNTSGDYLTPVNVYSSSVQSQFIGLKGCDLTLYRYGTNLQKDQAMTGMANSNGVVDKNYYYTIEGNTGIYTHGYDAEFPYNNAFETITVLGGSELFNVTSVDKNSYSYTNCVVHRQGMGFCGFEKIKTVNKRGQLFTTTYEPFNYGMVKKTETPQGWATYSNSVVRAANKTVKALVNSAMTYDGLRGVLSTTTYNYDSYGQLLKESVTFSGNNSLSAETTYSYNNTVNIPTKYRLGQLNTKTAKTTRNGSIHTETQSLTYNTKGQPLTIVEKVNGNTAKTTSMVYDYSGNMTSQGVTPFSSNTPRTSTYQYDYYGRVTSTTDPVGVWKTFTYNANGTVQKTTDYTGETLFTYDGFGRLMSETAPDGTVQSTSLTWNTDNGGLYAIAKNSTGHPTTTTIYNALNQEVRTAETRYDGVELKVDKTYDAYGNLVSETIPYRSGTPPTNTYTYDTHNRIIEKTERGKTTTYTYNWLSTTVSDGTMSSTTTTDVLGGVVSVTDPAGTITYTLNGAGKPTAITTPADNDSVSTTFTYDGYERKIIINDPSHGQTTYTYDTDGNLSSETNANNQTISYEYDVYGRMTKKTLPEFYTTYSYDNNLNVLTSKTSSNGTSTTYTYDSYGRLASTTETGADNRWLRKDYT